MLPSSWTSAALTAAGLLAYAPTPGAHLYMMTPVTRNLWATAPFQGQAGENINHCPHCFQSRGPAAVRKRGGGAPWPHFNGDRAENGNYIESDEVAQRHGICGDPEQTAAEGENKYGKDNSYYPVLETYDEGGILEVKIVVSAHHWGHVEMFLCDANDLPDGPDGTVIQSCFNKYPLNRAEDDEINQPIDSNHPGRMILDPMCRAGETDQTLIEGAYPGDVATGRYQLPPGLTCERCVVQMVYYTGNSCKHQGYAEFNPDSWGSSCAPNKSDWINEDVGFCGEGDNYPEEFWNCADISISSGGEAVPVPELTPLSDYDSEAYPAPTPAPASDGEYETYPAPTPESETYPAPTYVDEEPYEYDEPTPSPVDATPATPFHECQDPVGQYRQCGGTDYAGSTCCQPGYECTQMADCYSECRPRSTGTECAEEWGQCGGTGWTGSTCCAGDLTCKDVAGAHFSQCRPN
eukprot:g5551.t1